MRLEVVPRTFWACGVVVQHVVTIRSWSIDYPSTERSLRLPWRRGRFGGGTALGGEGGATPRGSEGEEQGAIVARYLAIVWQWRTAPESVRAKPRGTLPRPPTELPPRPDPIATHH